MHVTSQIGVFPAVSTPSLEVACACSSSMQGGKLPLWDGFVRGRDLSRSSTKFDEGATLNEMSALYDSKYGNKNNDNTTFFFLIVADVCWDELFLLFII